MIGHVVLAAHMRAERQPLLQQKPARQLPVSRLGMWLVVIGAAVLLPS
jgi:hypothetical protein